MISESTICDSNGEEYLSSELSLIPTHVELQTQLDTLHFSSDKLSANMKWIGKQRFLKDLSIGFYRGHNHVIQQVSFLTNLTRSMTLGHQYIRLPMLLVHIRWLRLQALQDLTISNFRLCLTDDIVGLLQLPHLTHLSFAGSVMKRDQHIEHFASFVGSLGPHVTTVFPEGLQAYAEYSCLYIYK